MMSSGFGSGRERTILIVVICVLAVAVGVGLIWLGFALGNRNQEPAAVEPSPTPTSTVAVGGDDSPAASPTPTALLPTATSLPTATPLPTDTPIPPTPTVSPATIEAGVDGSNVRTGPGTNFTRIGYLDPGTQTPLIGRYEDWWQIEYEGEPAWVFSGVATASNADDVPEVEPPPSPTPAPVTEAPAPTEAPPEPTQAPAANTRGLVINGYSVEGAPGPFGTNQDIWFNIDLNNSNDTTFEYQALGTEVEGHPDWFKNSYFHSSFEPNQHFRHRDWIRIPQPGSYNLWLSIRFSDGIWARLAGPVPITVQ